MSGFPTHLYEPDGTSISIADKLNFNKFHHYFKGIISTQYCSFQQLKSNPKKWIALHPDEQHNTFLGLIKCLNTKIDEHIDDYVLPDKGKKESINIQLYYPLIILQSDIYESELINDELKLYKTNHIVFKKQFASTKGNQTYLIDVINISFLPEYLRIINKEVNTIKDRIKRKKSNFYDSLDIMLSLIKKAKSPKEFREIIEF